MSIFRGIVLHLCVICSFACIIAEILDWYNPFMDFSGHMFYVHAALYLGVIVIAVTGRGQRRPRVRMG